MNYKFIFLLIFALITNLVTAQENKYVWFFEKGYAKSDILYKPQDYIEQEKIFDDLIITAPLETNVLSPVNGTISRFQYTYFNSLITNVVFGEKPTNYKADSLLFAKQSTYDVKFISVSMSIKTNDGKVIHISGIRPVRSFKTGERVKAGDIIGKIGYFYNKISKPAIRFSITEKEKPIDPMSPFGLKSSFVDFKAKEVTFLSKEETNFDFDLFIGALKEIMPDIYDYVSESDFEKFVTSKKEELNTQVHIRDFERVIVNTINIIRDSHLSILSQSYSNKNPYIASISFGWLNDSLFVTRTTLDNSKYYKRKISEVDGISADSLKKLIKTYTRSAGGYVVSVPEFALLTVGHLDYFLYGQNATSDHSLNIKFDNGEIKYFEGIKTSPGSCVPLFPDWKEFYLTNRYREKYLVDSLDKQTAYIGLSTFELNEVETDNIEYFIREISQKEIPNLIIDLRNNPGGDISVVSKLFSFITQEPFYLGCYTKVNKRGGYEYFSHSLNYKDDTSILFPDYHKMPDRDGFYRYYRNEIQSDTTTNYKGRVYVLTNERSFSASTDFAGLVKKYRRGVTVGRETGSTYHQLKSKMFTNLRLPNSNIDIRIPMVKTVFDTVVNNTFPWGRGVLPDYEVKLTLEELAYENGDTILNYTKSLISENKYIIEQEETSSETVSETTNKTKQAIAVATLLLVVVLIVIFKTRRGKK